MNESAVTVTVGQTNEECPDGGNKDAIPRSTRCSTNKMDGDDNVLISPDGPTLEQWDEQLIWLLSGGKCQRRSVRVKVPNGDVLLMKRVRAY